MEPRGAAAASILPFIHCAQQGDKRGLRV